MLLAWAPGAWVAQGGSEEWNPPGLGTSNLWGGPRPRRPRRPAAPQQGWAAALALREARLGPAFLGCDARKPVKREAVTLRDHRTGAPPPLPAGSIRVRPPHAPSVPRRQPRRPLWCLSARLKDTPRLRGSRTSQPPANSRAHKTNTESATRSLSPRRPHRAPNSGHSGSSHGSSWGQPRLAFFQGTSHPHSFPVTQGWKQGHCAAECPQAHGPGTSPLREAQLWSHRRPGRARWTAQVDRAPSKPGGLSAVTVLPP